MRKRKVGITIRVTEKEKETLKFLSENCHLNLSDYLRNLGLGEEVSPFPLEDFYRIYKSVSILMRDLDGFSREQIGCRLRDIKDRMLKIYLAENENHGTAADEDLARR